MPKTTCDYNVLIHIAMASVLTVGACMSAPDHGREGPGGQGGQAGQGGGAAGAGGTGGGMGGGGGKPSGPHCGGGGATLGFPSTEYRNPIIECTWGPTVGVMATPMVADLDRDGTPEIVFPGTDDNVYAISGKDCHLVWKWTRDTTTAPNSNHDIALADLDGDGAIEVVAGMTYDVVILDGKTGTERARLKVPGMSRSPGEPMSIANVDGMGPPEILMGNGAFRFVGGKIEQVWLSKAKMGAASTSSIADFDGDGIMEIVTGGYVLDGATGNIIAAISPVGFTAVADVDPDYAGPEIIVTGADVNAVYVLAGMADAKRGTRIWDVVSTGKGGGPPAVADYDGDGEPEIGVAGADHYSVVDRDCFASPLPDKCAEHGVLWRKETQDKSSYATTSTVFDFNCDGKAEVIYRDECFLRVFDGLTGEVRFATTSTSITVREGVVVADTSGNGHARIVAGMNDRTDKTCPATDMHTGEPFTGGKNGIMVLRDPMDRWTPTRPIWNQNAYHVTNVNDDGTIPVVEAPSWSRDNSYRAQAPKL